MSPAWASRARAIVSAIVEIVRVLAIVRAQERGIGPVAVIVLAPVTAPRAAVIAPKAAATVPRLRTGPAGALATAVVAAVAAAP